VVRSLEHDGVAPSTQRPDPTTGLRAWALLPWASVAAFLVVMAVPALSALVQPVDDAAWAVAVALEAPVPVALAKVLDVIGGRTVALGAARVLSALVIVERWGPRSGGRRAGCP
jgi:hypothetical protein